MAGSRPRVACRPRGRWLPRRDLPITRRADDAPLRSDDACPAISDHNGLLVETR